MTNAAKDTKSRYRKKPFITCGVILLLLVLDVVIFGYGKFAYHTIRCGGVPFAVEVNDFKGGSTYLLPGNYMPGFWKAGTIYECTEAEALDRGAKKDLYNNRPVLNSDSFAFVLVGGVTGLLFLWWIIKHTAKLKSAK